MATTAMPIRLKSDEQLQDLPQLSKTSIQHPHCCASLSYEIISLLAEDIQRAPHITLSIGSGSGLLEALLQQYASDAIIEGVEVAEDVNRYLPKEKLHIVGGTWDLCDRASAADTWLFIYPKDVLLVGKYLEAYGKGTEKRIIWLGPQADWPILHDFVHDMKVLVSNVKSEALAPYEKLVLIDQLPAKSTRSKPKCCGDACCF